MTKLSYWLAGAASVLAALFANAAPAAAARGDTDQADKQDVPDVSSAARKQIEEKTAPAPGRDSASFLEEGPMFAEHKRLETDAATNPDAGKGAPGTEVMEPSSGSDPNPPPSSRNMPGADVMEPSSGSDPNPPPSTRVENPIASAGITGGEKANDPAGDPLGPGFIEIPEPKRDAQERIQPTSPDVQNAFDKNQLPPAPAARDGH